MKKRGGVLIFVFSLAGWSVVSLPARFPATVSPRQEIKQIEEVSAQLFPLSPLGWSAILQPLEDVQEINSGKLDENIQSHTEAGYLPNTFPSQEAETL